MAHAVPHSKNAVRASLQGALHYFLKHRMNRLTQAALAALTAACCAQAHADVTHQYRSAVYETVRNFTGPCDAGTCAALSFGQRVQGTFTSAALLPPNIDMSLPGKVLPYLTGWSLSNGAITIGNASPGARVNKFQLHTDSTGTPDHSAIIVSQWADGEAGSPHKAGDRVHFIVANTLSWDAANQNYTVTNAACTSVGTSIEGVADTCLTFDEPAQSSSRATYASGTVSVMDLPLATITSAALPEGNSGSAAFLFEVSLNRMPDAPVSVGWRTADGTAKALSDYTAASGTLTWAAGEAGAKTIAIQVHGDTASEDDETFSVLLENLVGAGGGASTKGTGTILNDDLAPPPPTVSIDSVSAPEGTGGASAITFTVTLSRTPTAPASVNFATADGTATGADYVNTAGTLTWAAGDAPAKTIQVKINPDREAEPDETFSVRLYGPSGATLASGGDVGTGTILNDDSRALPPPGGVRSVPTLSDWALLALSAALIGAAAFHRRYAPARS